ncbi:MAG: hypothetical protein AAF500_11490 [Myxococcota bacterium]
MHRFIIVALAVLMVASCDRFPDNGLQVGGMLPLEDDCTVDPATELRRSSGLWDTKVLRNYIVTPLLENYIVSRALDIQAEQNNLQVTNLEITLQTPDGLDLVLPEGFPNPYSVTATTVLPAAVDDGFTSGTTRSVGVPQDYELIVADAVEAAGFDQVIVVMEAVGTTMGGFTQKSGPFFWPVTFCFGCLDFCATQEQADSLTDEQIARLDASCQPGQDIYPYCTVPPTPTEE